MTRLVSALTVVIAVLTALVLFAASPAVSQDSCESERTILTRLVVRLSQGRSHAEMDLAKAEARLVALTAEIERLKAEKAKEVK